MSVNIITIFFFKLNYYIIVFIDVNFNIDYAEKNIEDINELKFELNLYKNNNKNFYELVSLAEVSNIILKEKLKNARVSN